MGQRRYRYRGEAHGVQDPVVGTTRQFRSAWTKSRAVPLARSREETFSLRELRKFGECALHEGDFLVT